MLTPPTPHRVVPLLHELGTVAGHRLVLLSLEVYGTWSDLRFARIDVAGERPLPRRVPPAEAWTVTGPDGPVEVLDAVGRGDRAFSNGEVRLARSPSDAGETWTVTVEVLAGEGPLTATVELSPARRPAGPDA